MTVRRTSWRNALCVAMLHILAARTLCRRTDELIIEREPARHHLSFGFDIHRWIGLRLAELQLKVVWRQLLERFDHIEVTGEPRRRLRRATCAHPRMTCCWWLVAMLL